MTASKRRKSVSVIEQSISSLRPGRLRVAAHIALITVTKLLRIMGGMSHEYSDSLTTCDLATGTLREQHEIAQRRSRHEADGIQRYIAQSRHDLKRPIN